MGWFDKLIEFGSALGGSFFGSDDVYDLIDPGFGGSAEMPGSGNGLLSKQLEQVTEARPRNEIWSNPFVGGVLAAGGKALIAPDARDYPREAKEVLDHKQAIYDLNYRPPKP